MIVTNSANMKLSNGTINLHTSHNNANAATSDRSSLRVTIGDVGERNERKSAQGEKGAEEIDLSLLKARHYMAAYEGGRMVYKCLAMRMTPGKATIKG